MSDTPTYYETRHAGVTLDRGTFIRDYATYFVAAWTAKHYEEYCASDRHSALGRPPWEDALYMGEQAWDHLIEVSP